MDTYEKKYNEAMLRADEAVQKGCLDKDMFDIIFPPEESEDERIRKALVWHLKAGEDFVSNGVTKAECIAYLEKQKDSVSNAKYIQDVAHAFEDGRKKGQEEEQKPEIELKQVTEEQLHNLNEAIKGLRMDGCERMADSLYSLYNILKTQEPKPAWSEEDKSILDALIYDIERLPMQGVLTHRPCDSYIKFLKSLRPGWKPSELHLSALLAIFNDPDNIGSATCQLALTDLYEHLKKLSDA